MHTYNTILFDLDGTLTDPGTGITNSVAHALRRLGIEPPAREALYKFIGPPLLDSFIEYYGLSDEDAARAVAYYREYFRATGIYENRVYDGIPQLLAALRAQGKTLVLATSKPEPFARQILEHFQLAQYFHYAAGSNLDGTRTKKAEVIQYALSAAQIRDTASAVMVGDRKHDILGAQTANLDSIGVLFGYGDRAELEAAGAMYIAESVEALARLLA